MIIPRQAQQHVCLPCLLRLTKYASFTTNSGITSPRPAVHSNDSLSPVNNLTCASSKRAKLRYHWHNRGCKFQSRPFSSSHSQLAKPVTSESKRLTPIESQAIVQVKILNEKLIRGLAQFPEQSSDTSGVPIETLLASISKDAALGAAGKSIASAVEQVYAGKSSSEVTNELAKIKVPKLPKRPKTVNRKGMEVLVKLGIAERKEQGVDTTDDAQSSTPVPSTGEDDSSGGRNKTRNKSKLRIRRTTSSKAQAKPVRKIPQGKKIRRVSSLSQERKRALRKVPKASDEEKVDTVKLSDLKKIESLNVINSSLLEHSSVETTSTQKIPSLSFDLARVLFNPGVYQLQDPRSRVFNFDPYLQHIIPVEQFNFEALNKYLTSSEDDTLRKIASKHSKRYIGSSSSMTGVLSHFHFLLSAWRPIEINALSRRFQDQNKNFTQITRGPAAIFLRWKDGSYAVDADKEFDSSNILMNMGKALEKLLTLEKADFERYRRSPNQVSAELLDTEPEAFHYSELGDFLMRSQLDARDPRLPGTGTFDLKTRAVAGVRMNIGEYEVGKGYQIKDRLGTWESYEREYFDMMRSAFLKYSLQVRMGRMDGIFVAYHNVARMFGFQYIPVPELDHVLHGQSDPTLGDREFRLSVGMMNEIFNMATKEFPEQSIRFHFETRPESKADPNGYMVIFAEPMTEDEIQSIQDSGKSKAAEMEKKLLYPELAATRESDSASPLSNSHGADSEMGNAGTSSEPVRTPEAKSPSSTKESSDADVAFLDHISSDDVEDKAVERALVAWKLTTHHEINGKIMKRPQNLRESDQWTVRYGFVRMNDENAWVKYRACKKRRRATLEWPEDRPDTFFLRQIRQLNEKGAAWRKEQDQLDAGREQVLLYSNTGWN